MGKTAHEAICERKTDANLRSQIELLFEQQLFIPIIRTDDSIRVGAPKHQQLLVQEENVRAAAGPLSPPQARDLFQYLKSPHRKGASADVRLTDHSKGVERMARKKCREMGVDWVEWWPFLQRNVDLSSLRGLELLEHHFKNIRNTMLDLNNSSLTDALEKLQIRGQEGTPDQNDDNSDEDVFETPPSSPVPFFVQGSSYSLLDRDAFYALEHADIDCLKYPLTHRWREKVGEMLRTGQATPMKKVVRSFEPVRLAFTP